MTTEYPCWGVYEGFTFEAVRIDRQTPGRIWYSRVGAQSKITLPSSFLPYRGDELGARRLAENMNKALAIRGEQRRQVDEQYARAREHFIAAAAAEAFDYESQKIAEALK